MQNLGLVLREEWEKSRAGCSDWHPEQYKGSISLATRSLYPGEDLARRQDAQYSEAKMLFGSWVWSESRSKSRWGSDSGGGDVDGISEGFLAQSSMPVREESQPVKPEEALIVESEAVAGRRGCFSSSL